MRTTLLVLITLLLSACGGEVIIKFKGGPTDKVSYGLAITYQCPDGYAMTGRMANDNSIQVKRITCTWEVDQ